MRGGDRLMKGCWHGEQSRLLIRLPMSTDVGPVIKSLDSPFNFPIRAKKKKGNRWDHVWAIKRPAWADSPSRTRQLARLLDSDKPEKRMCALHLGLQPGSLGTKNAEIDHQKCHRTTYPHILFSAKAAAKNPSICVPLLPPRAPRARSHLVCAEANVEFNYRAAGIFIDLLYQRENRWTFTVAEI